MNPIIIDILNLIDGTTRNSAATIVGNAVDLKSATYTNDFGATQSQAVWTDPNFNPA